MLVINQEKKKIVTQKDTNKAQERKKISEQINKMGISLASLIKKIEGVCMDNIRNK